jgi:glycosyltransferase involved in cell wall biosynthesis
MRILILWTHLSGYMRACLDRLGQMPGIELHVVSMPPDPSATFEDHEVSPATATCYWLTPSLDLPALHDRLQPDALVVCSWHIGAYRRLARRSRALRVLAMDNQWLGTLKQRLGIAVSPWFLRPAYDRALVPGDRAAQFASRLGFGQDAIWRGSYCGDVAAFLPAGQGHPSGRRRFLFVGRLVPEKGVDVLLDAYARYREAVAAPWSLTVCGAGPLAGRAQASPGVEHHGFVQPSALPKVFHDAGAFVLPSRFEPWGVVIHEACAAGLPIVCSSSCGAVPSLVEDHWNGFIVEPGSVTSLTSAMRRVHHLDATHRDQMGRRSSEVARRYTPERWAHALVARIEWDRKLAATSYGENEGSQVS